MWWQHTLYPDKDLYLINQPYIILLFWLAENTSATESEEENPADLQSQILNKLETITHTDKLVHKYQACAILSLILLSKCYNLSS